MIKTQIQLEEWQYEALKKESGRERRSLSELIRQAVTEALGKSKAAVGLNEVAGKYAPQSVDDLKAHGASWVESLR